MDINQLIIPPKTIAFATTYQCSATCLNCCFGCNPQIKVRLSLAEMKKYVDESCKYYGDTLKVLVLTGGESFLLQDDLRKIVEYGSSKGLITRIVTNGYWAKNYQKSYETLLTLRDSGLKEINFSTGDDHQKWVPYENIVNGCSAAMDLKLTCIVNVEIHDNSQFDANIFMNDSRLTAYFDFTKYETPLKIEKGLWISFDANSNISTDNIQAKDDISHTRCHSLFSTIPINPYSYMMSCCGLVSERIVPFRLGSLKDKTVKELYEMQFYDLIKIWLFVEGPYSILKYIHNKRGIDKKISGHICSICANIFKEDENIQCIKDNYRELMSSVMFKYILLKPSL